MGDRQKPDLPVAPGTAALLGFVWAQPTEKHAGDQGEDTYLEAKEDPVACPVSLEAESLDQLVQCLVCVLGLRPDLLDDCTI